MFAIIDRKLKKIVGQTTRSYADPNLGFVAIDKDVFTKFSLDPTRYADYKVVTSEDGKLQIAYNPSRSFSQSRLVELGEAKDEVDVLIVVTPAHLEIVSKVAIPSVELTGLLEGRFDQLVFHKDLTVGDTLALQQVDYTKVRVFVTFPIKGYSYGVVYR